MITEETKLKILFYGGLSILVSIGWSLGVVTMLIAKHFGG